MRIFYAAPDYALGDNIATTKLWRANLYETLRDMGHELVEFDVDYQPFNLNLDPNVESHRRFIDKHRPVFSENLLKQVRAAQRQKPLDLFFSYFYSAYVEPDAIREIGRLGIPTVNWYCNASYQFNLVEDIAPAYDFCLVPEKFRLDDYRRAGANPIYCQEAANPNVYKPHDVPVEYDVTFVGQKYGTRGQYLGRLHKEGIDARAWGPFWKKQGREKFNWRIQRRRLKNWLRGRPAPLDLPQDRCGPTLSDDELINMYSRSKISLGFSVVAASPSDGSPPIKQVRLRDFEATMSGAFYLVEGFEELAEFLEPDKEIVFFHDEVELVDKAKYYLAHDADRRRIRAACLKRVRAEHTWHRRFEMVFDKMGLTNAKRKDAG